MRNFFAVLTVITIFLVSFVCGYYIYKENTKNDIPKQLSSQIAEKTGEKSGNTFSPSLMTSTIEQKISPNATLVVKKYYKECGHTTKNYAEIPAEFVNLREEELKENLTAWQIKGFSPDEIVIYQEAEGICDEHYIIKDEAGNVAIYSIDKNNNESLVELTEIAIQYLTEQDQINLQQGIIATGREELNSVLEDFE